MTTNNISAGYSGHTRLALQLDNGILTGTGNACLMSSGLSALSVQEAMSDVTAAATMHSLYHSTDNGEESASIQHMVYVNHLLHTILSALSAFCTILQSIHKTKSYSSLCNDCIICIIQ